MWLRNKHGLANVFRHVSHCATTQHTENYILFHVKNEIWQESIPPLWPGELYAAVRELVQAQTHIFHL